MLEFMNKFNSYRCFTRTLVASRAKGDGKATVTLRSPAGVREHGVNPANSVRYLASKTFSLELQLLLVRGYTIGTHD